MGKIQLLQYMPKARKHTQSWGKIIFIYVYRMGKEMSTPITLSPPPGPYKETRDFEVVEATISDTIDVLGFLTIAEVASPPILSRHLILPAVSGTDEETR